MTPLQRMESLARRIEYYSIPEPNSGCLLWIGSMGSGSRYGRIMHEGKNIRTHRAAWMVKNGEIPKNTHVLHSCDTTACINPDHLFLGSHLDNMKDMKAKGRLINHRGIDNGNAKLTDDAVRDIRASSLSLLALAKKYNVSKFVVSQARRRLSWKHIS